MNIEQVRAEIAASIARKTSFFYQMHRDTRLSDLTGDAVIVREADAATGGEVIFLAMRPGGLLTAEVAVLDDISRASGEALNVLLRLLDERRWGSADLPLLTAVATGNPPREGYYNEPLDPGNLDRFALQARRSGWIPCS